ncbi:hypothetical protein [Pluralibacter gergoviae]|uniref:hypothetical protein n=1 Tax=Pluralibacter gergoviae TaxID=61647 RepID=UPI001FF646C8|nr:hypothetical protein [Pluralibacter gergoviae]MCK1065033.1 hypothetical protein [Pluralibacter gergoviae]
MTAVERWDDDGFIIAVSAVIPEPEMTHELAAQEAIADYWSEREEARMNIWNYQN